MLFGSEAAEAGYIYKFLPPSDSRQFPLLLLHRTGGNENDLVAAAKRISPGAAIIAVRGNVLEDGKPRFFRRLARGKFDIDDLERRTEQLAAFVHSTCSKFKLAAPIALGFSNGANIAWSLILRHPSALSGAILLRPYLAYDPLSAIPLLGIPVLVIAGRADETVPRDRVDALPRLLNHAGARAVLKWVPGAHDFTIDDEVIASEWISDCGADRS